MPTRPLLVKYETPVLLSEVKHKKALKEKKRVAVGAQSGPQAEDVLYSIIPPREFEENGQQWVQYVSSIPATRMDVINLQERLDSLLLERNARETGICPVREELYSQVFDELIRQVTVNCAERGLLLLRVRDELRMTLDAYRSLYESSAAYGMRKALQAEQSKIEMESKIQALEREKEELKQQVEELEYRCESIIQQEKEKFAEAERKHNEEVAFFRRTYQTLTTNLQTLCNATKA
ncbi:dynein light chain p28, axonemal, putative [Trypanosoma equiperdum]|uniref:Dynein arm light chain, axonemal, putative n=4 Tax=Trypanozoon TaxID=39700 RepID=Q385L7_TRYB2|nr:dynein arm light chain, axonemal, putative [Trypanosoma brucei gambiense DAL972]XP_828626.1 dynein arm light chain axonemal [Trypanosoma brucei brucei TREU927]EAN79514.1 dynein arm light chain, axonemal, putative [Trypanosoma brucei brucei TREU927]CBH17504.1 dynein arm light chain, axonemal, putative [Trypanosoma brucei gambiense DAL972]SCU66360.1 dynein light chain p28, axonemal, putative [Trypanosoma equiperdum]|eukprot:XP_011779768.1 dynein arm light chain, axonemal, putative [Trypanosoma brucei gambiense DAL972]